MISLAFRLRSLLGKQAGTRDRADALTNMYPLLLPCDVLPEPDHKPPSRFFNVTILTSRDVLLGSEQNLRVVFAKEQTEILRLKSIWFARTQESSDSRVSGLIISAGRAATVDSRDGRLQSPAE